MSFKNLLAALGTIAMLSPQCSASAPLKIGKRDLSLPSTLPGTWRYEGCYTCVMALDGANT